MAKQSNFTIEDIQKELRSINPFGNTLDKSESGTTSEWYGTGNYHLNAAISADMFKGIPNNRSICVSGSSGAGKSFFALNLCREAQAKGAYIIYYDTEGAIDLESVKSFGIDPKKFDHQPTSDLNTFRTSITTICKRLMDAKSAKMEIPKLFIVLDSLGMLATKKEIDDAQSGNTAADMTRAKMIRSLFRIITSDLSSLGIPLVYTNHTYDSVGSFIPTINISGGGGVIYAASVIINLTKAQIKDGTVKTGIIVSVNTMKNRFARPIPIKLHIRWDSGMNPYIGMEEYISWETCGIQKGNLLTEKEYEKLSQSDKDKCSKFEHGGKIMVFSPRETATKFVIKHLGDTVKPNQLFTSTVFTQEILETINEKCIKPRFSYGSGDDALTDEVDNFLNDDSEE